MELKVAEPPQRGERRAVLKKVSQVEALFAGFHIVGLDHPDLYPLTLLSVILSGGKASRFYQDFVRPGKAVELSVELAPLPFSSQDPDLYGGGGRGRAGEPPGRTGAGNLGRAGPVSGKKGSPPRSWPGPKSWCGPRRCAPWPTISSGACWRASFT